MARTYVARAEQCEADGNREEGVRWFEFFERGFFAFRIGLAIKMRLAREARSVLRQRDDEGRERPERLETERPDRPEGEERLEYTERDRDRDTERASFPLLLKTLNGLVADAEAMPGPQPAELLSLKELLAQVSLRPRPRGEGPGVGVLARRPAVSATRTDLLTSTRTPPPQPIPGRGRGLRATGPPLRRP
jgi:hypothetical protein